MLNTVFVRNIAEQSDREPIVCSKCDAKLKSMEFHANILQLYRQQYAKLSSMSNPAALNLFLKHMKNISHLLTNDISSGVLAEIVLPIFRVFKAQRIVSNQRQPQVPNIAMSASSPKLCIQINSNEVNDDMATLKILHECLDIFIIYLSDIRLIKAFYNEENIKHLEDLLVEPELVCGICDLIKIGIDNLTFLGDNSQEQSALSHRLITLQLNSSDRSAQLFNALLYRYAKHTKTVGQELFWLNEIINTDDNYTQTNEIMMEKPLDILITAALQWTLNYELLKTSQVFCKEFSKIYSIDVDNADDCNYKDNKEMKLIRLEYSKSQRKDCNDTQDGRTIADILNLNYNALCSFLLFQRRKTSTSMSASMNNSNVIETQRKYNFEFASLECDTSNIDNVIDCLSSSMENLISGRTFSYFASTPIPQSLTGSWATTSATPSNAYDSDNPCDNSATYNHVTQFFTNINGGFLQKIQLQKQKIINDDCLLEESIVLFDIRNQMHINDIKNAQTAHSMNVTNNGSSSGNLAAATTTTTNVNTTAADMLTTLYGDPQTHGGLTEHNESIIRKLLGVFGALFSGSHTDSVSHIALGGAHKRSEYENEIDTELLCLSESNGEGRKLVLKLFEATMSICIKGYQNEEAEKMQKHLGKLKATIISHATANWQQLSEEQTRENTVLQALQTLLKIAELSNTTSEPAPVVSSSILTTATDDATLLRPRVRSFNSQTARSQCMATTVHQQKTAGDVKTPPTPRRIRTAHSPLSGESVDVDYFSTRNSMICADSEVEFSENENDDYYLTADEGYEADAEIPEISNSEMEVEVTELWNSFQPTSRYRAHILHSGLCRLIVEILIELSQMCIRNPVGWSGNLAQLANRLFVIRDNLGGPLFLMNGFTPILKCSDVRLRELQQSILELITDLNTPDVLCTFFGILSSKSPPVDILMKFMSHVTSTSLKKIQPNVELEFPIVIDGKCVSTSDPTLTEHIDGVRNYQFHCQATTPFTRAPCIIPITHARVWNNEGLTLSLWLQIKSSQLHKSTSQLIDDDTRSSSDDYLKSHILSIGSNNAMLSVYINSNMNLVFETCRPNAQLQMRPVDADDSSYEANNSTMQTINVSDARSSTKAATTKASITNRNGGNVTSSSSSNIMGASPFRNALKQTKLVLLNSFSNIHLFNGLTEDDAYFESSSIDIKYFRLAKNKWTHLVIAINIQTDSLDLNIYIDGLDHHILNLPFRNLRNLTRAHIFQLITLGDSIMSKSSNNTPSCNDSRSTLDGHPFRFSISNLMLFNRKIITKEVILNLTAMGPDFNELTQCQVTSWKPNYGYLNLSKMASANFGNVAEAMKLLRDACSLVYTAQQPDRVMVYDTSPELDSVYRAHPHGLILYGELIQNHLQTLQTASILSGGLSTLMYMFARVVEITNHSASQAMALDILLSVALSESQLYAEFLRNDFCSLIGYVIKTERCTKDVHLLKSIVNNACSQPLISKRADALHVNENTVASLVYPRLLVSVLHRYSDWHRSGAEHSDVLEMLFFCILALTREKHPLRDFNMEQLNRSGLVKELLNLCKVYVIESPNPVYISKDAAHAFVAILSVFAGSPPSASLMDEIMKLLLLLHKPSECYITHDRSKFYFLLTSQLPTKENALSLTSSNLSRVAAPFRRNFLTERPGIAVPVSPTSNTGVDADAQRQNRINRLKKLHASMSPYTRPLREFEENLEQVANCTKLNKSALRLVNPVGVSNWLLKYKRTQTVNTTSPNKIRARIKYRTSPPAARPIPSNLTQTKLGRKRLRLQTMLITRPLGDGQRRDSSARKRLNLSDTSLGDFPSGTTLNDVLGGAGVQRRSKCLIKMDFYNSLGIVTLQEGLFTLLKDFLCLLPDSVVEDVLKHYVKVESLLVLANNGNCAVRAAIIRLLMALTKRLAPSELLTCNKSYYPQHLANQLSIYATDLCMFEPCVEWVTGIYGDLQTILNGPTARIQQRFGLNALLAIAGKAAANQAEFGENAFQLLHKLYNADPDDQQLLIETGLLQCSIKTLYNLYQKSSEEQSRIETAILSLLTSVGEKSLKSIGHINILWDILNMISFYQEKQQSHIIRRFRALQGQLQLNWINMFFHKTNVPWNFKVATLAESTLTLAETKTRLDLLIDRCSQFFTVFDADYTPTTNEIKLFEFLVSYSISTNQRCNNFIAWGLQPSRQRELRAFIVDALWISCQDDFVPAIICDGKMIKSLLWLCLLEDLDKPIENLEPLCKRLGISENDSVWNLETELRRLELNRNSTSAKQKMLLEKTVYKFETLALNCIESSMVTTRRVAELQNAERKLLMGHMKDYDESATYLKWLEIMRRMTHEGAPWYCKERNENSWELDDTEGPSRVHTRLRRCHLDIDKRFIMEDYHTSDSMGSYTHNEEYSRPLDYLITSYDQQHNISLNSQIIYNFPAKYLPVDGEIDGEIIVTDHKLYFLATYRCKYFYITCDISNITEIWVKRYQHQEKAFEIFLDTNQSLFFSLQNQDDWKIMRDVFCDKIVTPPDYSKVLLITQQWREGLLTNWEYLMTLNQIAGRTYNDLMQYPVFPWILSNYKSNILDLTDAMNFRKLEKPIAVQHPENEQHYINNYTYINNTMTNMGTLILKPYHYSSHYSNSGTVLHFLVRVPPFTSYFLRYQDNNFDLPDRTFHNLNTTWNLASHDSPTDVKELIPEFFSLPEMFENFERFNFGCRQSGERVEDVILPPWCLRDPRLFVLIHRQALECEIVRSNLHQWIDLIFGFKQTGDSAVEAINVFHPATYSVFLESEINDPIERKAVETMVKTYGQMPRQLFRSSHPPSKTLNYCLGGKEILPNVRGLRWGVYLGSPQLPPATLGNIYNLRDAEQLISFHNTNVIYGLPVRSCIMQGAEIDTFNVISWGFDDRIVRIQPLNKMYTKPKNLLYNNSFDDITACGADPNSNQLWFGHKSGRISVYKCFSTEVNGRTSKSRQSYVRGLRLSYNSAFRKITTKSNIKTDADVDSEMAMSTLSTSSLNSIDAEQRDGIDMMWSGPTVLIRHTDEITCIHLSVDFKIAVSTGRDGLAVIWDLNHWSYIRTIERPAEIHHSPITLTAISPTLGDIVTVHTIPWHNSNTDNISDPDSSQPSAAQTADECFEVTEESLDDFVNVSVNPNGKSILRLHSINARYIQHIVHEERILAVCYSYIKEGVGVNVIATAVEGGIVRLWSSWNLSFVNEIVTGISNIKSITYSTHQHLVVLTKESRIQVWETEGLYGSAPKFPQIPHK